jgi:3-methyladenine DNA glycosylase/8-oxoguanine DNA glycosylase
MGRRTEAGPAGSGGRLTYTGLLDWEAMLGFFRARTIAGIEFHEPHRYVRRARIGDWVGEVEIRHEPNRLIVRVSPHDMVALEEAEMRARRMFDLDCDIASVHRHLTRDAGLAALIARRPGLRVPSGWDGYEVGVRAVLGQQVSVQAALALAARLVRKCGSETFPTAMEVRDAALDDMGMPSSRVRTLHAIAERAIDDPSIFEPGRDLETTVGKLLQIKGIGPWSAHYIALRACRCPDAFPTGDVGLLRAVGRPLPADLEAMSQDWRPWRSYAAQHLWLADADMAIDWPKRRNGQKTVAPDARRC